MESELYVYVYIVSIVLVIYTSLFLQFLAICFTNVSFDSTSSILAPQKHIARIRAANSTSLVVVEAAVMLEANWQDLVQSLLVVAVEQTEALRRLCVRNSLSETEANERINSQIDNASRIAKAQHVIWNEGDLAALTEQVSALYKDCLSK